MSLLRVSLRLLPLLALVAACTGKRADPEPSQNPPPTTGDGGNGGSNGGAPGNGGNGAGPATGGMGGTPSTGGMGGTPSTGGMGGAAGVGGSTFNDVSDMYEYCGCLDDSHEPGACTTCFDAAANDPLQCAPAGACDPAGCGLIVDFLRNDPACANVDEACLQQAYNIAPSEWDDAVDQVQCACQACPTPFGCNAGVCGG